MIVIIWVLIIKNAVQNYYKIFICANTSDALTF